MHCSGKKGLCVNGDDVFKGPVDPAVTSAVLDGESPEDVMSTLEWSWLLVRVTLTHTLLDFIFDCQQAWFVLTPGHEMSHNYGNLIKSVLYTSPSQRCYHLPVSRV